MTICPTTVAAHAARPFAVGRWRRLALAVWAPEPRLPRHRSSCRRRVRNPAGSLTLTSFSDRQRVTDILTAGATGYVLKDARPDDLLAAVRAAADGHVPLDPRVAAALLPARAPQQADQLSDREKQVLRLVAAGLANKQIARRLGIAESTVKVHTGNIFRRIGVADRTSAALWAREHLA